MDVIKKLEEKAKIANIRVTRIKKLQSMLTEDSIDSVAHRQSKIKLNQLLNKFDEVSSDGYGSILVKLDGTYDMFGCSSLSSRLYSENYIVTYNDGRVIRLFNPNTVEYFKPLDVN